MDEGLRLFHHGYLFELSHDEDGVRYLRAWPSAHGQTGLAAFLLDERGTLYGDANHAARWSGPSRAPFLAAGDGWRSLDWLEGQAP